MAPLLPGPMTEQRRRLPDVVPATYCIAGDGSRAAHEWAPLHEEDFFCRRCLARLDAECVDEWRQRRESASDSFEPAGVVSIDAGALAAEALSLTRLERRLLLRMASEPDAVILYSELAECVWGRPEVDAHDRAALRQHIATLRRKLALLRVEVGTVASVGYRFKFACAGELREAD